MLWSLSTRNYFISFFKPSLPESWIKNHLLLKPISALCRANSLRVTHSRRVFRGGMHEPRTSH